MKATNVRWRVLVLLVLSSFISYTLRYNVSTAAPAMMADLKITTQQLGYILAAFTTGYTIFQFPGGLFSDWLGPRRAMTIIMVLWGVLTILTSAVPGSAVAGTAVTVAALVVVRFLVGVVHAPKSPIAGGVVERWFPIDGWGLPNGLGSAGLTLGTAATASALAWMIGEYGWRLSFVLLSPLGFIAALLWWWYVRDHPHQHPAVNAAEVDLIAADRPAAHKADDDGIRWRQILKDRDVLLLTLSYFCMNYVFYQMFNWVFFYLVKVRGFEAQHAGYFTSFQWIAAAVGALFGGFVCDYLSRKRGIRLGCRLPAMLGLGLSGLFMLAASVSTNSLLAVGMLALSFLALEITEAAFWVAATSVGGRNAATACGVMNTGGNACGIVNALFVPFVAGTLGWTVAMITGTVFAALSAILWLFIDADRPAAD